MFAFHLVVFAFQGSVLAGTWSQTTQTEFAANILNDVDILSSGDVAIVRRSYSTDSNTVLLMYFNEGKGNPRDSSGKGNHGTNNGATWTSGRFGSALSFDGIDDYVRIAGNPSLNITDAITIEMWVKWLTKPSDGRNKYPGVAGKKGAWKFFGLKVNDTLHFYLIDSEGKSHNTSCGALRMAGVWDHYALTYDGSIQKLYVNRVLRNKKSWTGAIASTPAASIFLGKEAYRFNGIIDEVRISNKARSLDEISTSGRYFFSGTIISPMINSGKPITNIRLDREDTQPAGTSIIYSVTNDGGTSWHKLPGDNVLFAFPGTGSDLRIKAELRSGNGSDSPTLHSWKAEFSGDIY
jgi:hypothetical protein